MLVIIMVMMMLTPREAAAATMAAAAASMAMLRCWSRTSEYTSYGESLAANAELCEAHVLVESRVERTGGTAHAPMR